MLLALTGLVALACSGEGQTRVEQESHRLRRTAGGYYVVLPGGAGGPGSSAGGGGGSAGDPDAPDAGGMDPTEPWPAPDEPWPEEPCFEERDGMDADGDGTVGCGVVLPDPGFPDECARLQYREIHTVLVDASGELVSETFEFCTQCFGVDGTALGPEECTNEPITPPDSTCWEEGSPDGGTCYICVSPDGSVIDDGGSLPPPPPDDCRVAFCEARPDCCPTGDSDSPWVETCDLDLISWCVPPSPEEPPPPDDCLAMLLEVEPSCETAWSPDCDALFDELCFLPEPEPAPDDCFTRLLELDPRCESEWSEDCDALYNDLCALPPTDPCPPGGGSDGGPGM